MLLRIALVTTFILGTSSAVTAEGLDASGNGSEPIVVSGVLRQSDGTPLSGWSVRIGDQRTLTATDGSYALTSPFLDSTNLYVWPGDTDIWSDTMVGVTGLAVTASRTLDLTVAFSTFTITAVDATGNPVPDADVVAGPIGFAAMSQPLVPALVTIGEQGAQHAHTNSDGIATLQILAVTTHTSVTVTPPANTNLAPQTIAGVSAQQDQRLTVGFPSPPLALVVPGQATVVERDYGLPIVYVPVTLSRASAEVVSVHWSTVDYTASAPRDYASASGVLTFAPGETSKTVPISVRGDRLDEADEVALLAFSNPTNAKIGGVYGLGSATITDDDAPPTIVAGVASVPEGDGGSRVVHVPIRLSAPSGKTITVKWSTANVTAIAPTDYSAATGMVTFAPGQTAHSISVVVHGDTRHERDEVALVAFNSATNARLGVFSRGIVLIRDDD